MTETKSRNLFGVVLLVGVLVLGGILLVLHTQNERRYNDCLTANRVSSLTYNPCHKSWP